MPQPLLYRTALILLFVWMYTGRVWAQSEFVVTVDRQSGTVKRLDSIPGVMFIAPHAVFDETARRFLFVGLPSNRLSRSLFSIDAITGKVVSKAVLPKDPTLVSLRYDRSSHILYGITILSDTYSLVSIDVNTGIYTTIAPVKSMRGLAEEMIIDNNHRIFLNCVDTANHFSLICLDVNGGVLSKVAIPNITGLQYDHTAGKLYGLRYVGTTEQLIEVDPLTGTIATRSDLPADLQGILQYGQTFDEIQHQYIFAGIGKSGIARLFSVDVNSGAVIYSPLVPASANAIDKDNVIQFRFSNSLNKLFALHWKAYPDTLTVPCALAVDTKIYATPDGRVLKLNKSPTDCIVRMGVYTLLGQVIIENKLLNDGPNNVQLPNIAAGVYYYKLYSGNRTLLSGKIIIQQ